MDSMECTDKKGVTWRFGIKSRNNGLIDIVIKNTKICLLILFATKLWGQKEPVEPFVLQEQFVFEEADFPQCHASTLASLGNGGILAAWFGGKYERHPEVAIYTSRRDSSSWSEPRLVADGLVNDTLRYTTWNPVLFRSSSINYFCFTKWDHLQQSGGECIKFQKTTD